MSNLEPVRNRGQLRQANAVRRMPSVANTQQDDGEISLSFILGVWNQWWKWLIPISIVMIVASTAAVVMTFKPKYRSTARIKISENAPWVIEQNTNIKASQFVATQIEMLRSPLVLNSVLDDSAIANMPELRAKRDPVKWLSERGLDIQVVGHSTLVEIAFEGNDPDTASKLVNAVVENYFSTHSSQKTKRIQNIVTVLDNNKTMQAGNVGRLQAYVKKLSKNLDVVPNLVGPNLTMQTTSPSQELMNQIYEADFEVADLEAAVMAIQETLNNDNFTISDSLIQSEIDELPEVKSLRLEIQNKEGLLGQIEARAKQGTASTAYINMDADIQRLRGSLELLRARSRDSMAQKVREMDRITVESKLSAKRTELEQKRMLVQKLESRYDELKKIVNSEGDKRLEFDFASQELQRAVGLYAKISERKAQMTAELGTPGRPELYREAAPNYEPTQKYPVVELAATTLASLLIPFGIAFVWETTLRRINSVEQLANKTDSEVIGEISRLPARRGRNQKLLGRELGLFEESVDSLRTGLLLSNEDQDIQVIAVCSAVSGEGKTSISSQLAVSIARTGQPVLLIDGDMRAPDIHQIFEVPLSLGLADVLDGNASLEEAINRSWSEHVHLLPAGELAKSPHKLLGTPAFGNLIDEARLWYRYIVIDTPPVLAASESLVIAKQADGTIVCAMREFSRESHVRMAHERLRSTGADTIGTVLNGVPVRSYASRYGSYGRYGYTPQA